MSAVPDAPTCISMDTSGFSCWSRPVLLALVALAHPCDGLAPAAATGAARRWQCPTATMLQDAGSPVPVTIKEDGSGKCTATQKNIVFLTPVPTWGSSVMRGQLTAAAINDAWAEPLGVRATFCGPKTCDQAVEAHGGASVCVFTKYHWPEYVRKCRRLGALVLWDLIDNQEMANATYLLDHDVDAVVTVSRAHAAYLNAQGVPAVAMPHPHSNLGGWSVAHTSRPRVRGVGFVYADRQSLPSTEDLAFILSSVCAHGAVLYLVRTHNGEINIVPQKCNIQIDEDAAAGADSSAALVGCSSRAAAQAARNGVPPQCPGSAAGGQTALGRNAAEGELPDAPYPAMPDLPDSNSQREYYHSSELLRLIDLGLAWRPHRASEDPLMVSFRDGTRLAWWWAHGIPTIGFPTHAHLESALRTGYPVHLLNASTGPELSAVLCSVSRPGVRDCLRQHARRAAELTSPQASARDWLRAICRLGSICTPPTSVVVPRPQDVGGINKSCPFEHPHLPPLLKLHEPSGCLPERHAIARRLQEHWEAIDLLGRAAAANGSYAAQTPFPHTYMDGLFPEWMLYELDREFPDPGAAAAAEAAAGQADDELGKTECEAAHDERGWRCIMDQRGGYFKMTNAAEGHMGPYLQALHQVRRTSILQPHIRLRATPAAHLHLVLFSPFRQCCRGRPAASMWMSPLCFCGGRGGQ